jgi:hypothetical protein
MDPVDLSLEFMILVLHTSIGEHLQLVNDSGRGSTLSSPQTQP